MDSNQLISVLLTNRGLTTPSQIAEFFDPQPPFFIPLKETELDPKDVNSAIQLIKQHIRLNNKIAVYGDYDVDGICSTAILWENLHRLTPHVFPHIPHRREEGYGLSRLGIDQCLAQGARLIITVDNGIVAYDQIAYAKSHGADVIVIDHHERGDSLPPANYLIHSRRTSAAGLTWFFCRELSLALPRKEQSSAKKLLTDQLSLAAIAVVCDIIPLIGLNRSLVKNGLEQLRITHRPGLLALLNLAGVSPHDLDTYHLGFIIGPRLNAMGRLEHALDSLRLLCTTNPDRAVTLAQTLDSTNRHRQQLTEESTRLAISTVTTGRSGALPKLLVVADPSYDQGIIGLVAAKLVEKFHRPAIAISMGESESKASARSVTGFHITQHLRSSSGLFTSLGGHSMAAGFSLPTKYLEDFTRQIVDAAESQISDEMLVPNVMYDAEIPLSILDWDLYHRLRDFAPFGLGNPQPTFLSSKIPVTRPKLVGNSGQHLRFQAGSFPAIWFNAPEIDSPQLDIIYHLGVDNYHHPPALQLVIKSSLSL